MKLPDVKKVGSTAAKFGSATAGLVVGSKAANMIGGITLPSFIPPVVAEHLKKAAPGVLLMLAAYLASSKFKSKSELVEPGAIGVGLAGFANLLKAYFPSIAASYLPSLQGMGLYMDQAPRPSDDKIFDKLQMRGLGETHSLPMFGEETLKLKMA